MASYCEDRIALPLSNVRDCREIVVGDQINTLLDVDFLVSMSLVQFALGYPWPITLVLGKRFFNWSSFVQQPMIRCFFKVSLNPFYCRPMGISRVN